ncbi:MAG TPA: AmmeMemoRadiSam system protein B [Candidatus Hypogeohydataceae bacterium YC41]
MAVRSPIAIGFYPGSAGVCESALERYLRKASSILSKREKIVAGIVPHAGWIYSGQTAAAVYYNINRLSQPQTFVLLGSVHVAGVDKPTIMAEGSWETPLGEIEIDSALANYLLKECPDLLIEKLESHLMEHSIEVQVPFIQHLFPEANIVPIMVPATNDSPPLGDKLAQLLKGKKVTVIGTSDLTHYGLNYGVKSVGTGMKALAWVKEVNDKRMIDLCMSMNAEEIIPEASKNMNACGPGALAATVAYARALELTSGELLHYTTSYDVEPIGDPSSFVGYAGIVF